MDMHIAASVVLVNLQGKLIFQKRDNKPGIRNPGMITAWGGACKPRETPLQAAVREMCEETNMRPSETDFELLGTYVRDYAINRRQVVNHVFLLRGVDEVKLHVYEGQGYVVVDPTKAPSNPLYSTLTKELIVDCARLTKLA
jgi:8-oxo-dGTP pyrophosphatase MutT (NUDIX family)